MSRELLQIMPKSLMERHWNEYDWQAAEQELLENQKRLVKAVYAGNQEVCDKLQKRIVRSLSSKMLAVRKVCTIGGVAGTDKVRWKTADEKYMAALSLDSKEYHAKPYRHVVIETKSGKKRHIDIPSYYDRAMQVLYSYSLSPLAEANGERKSFAFRKGRSMQDVNEYIKDALQGQNAPCFIIKTDVKACYQSISHEWLLRNIPMDKHVLKEFLTAGYVFGGELFPADEFGISLGCNLSPILGNMTLDGMQKYLYQQLYGKGPIDYPNGNLIRFADDILITVRTRETAEIILEHLADFLYERGLRLSEQKTSIIPIEKGFDFLSRHYQKRRGVLMVCPSDSAVLRLEGELQDLILNHKGSQKSLIDKINHKLTGWGTYHRVSDATFAFRRIDVFVKAMLMKLCEMKHPTWNRNKILGKYWYLDYDGRYVYALKERSDIRVKRLADTILVEHQKVRTSANAYLDAEYLETRTDDKEIHGVTGKYRAVWNRQQGLCYYCGKPILTDQRKEIIQKELSRGERVSNLAYIHWQCRCSPVEIAYTDTMPGSVNDIMDLLHSLERKHSRKGMKFQLLDDFFHRCSQPSVSLSFREIEAIMGEPLCRSAYEKPQYWYKTTEHSISKTWRMNGYVLQRLYLEKKKIVLHRTERNNVPVEIPEVFLSGRVPQDAKCELENYFEFIRKKYGL